MGKGRQIDVIIRAMKAKISKIYPNKMTKKTQTKQTLETSLKSQQKCGDTLQGLHNNTKTDRVHTGDVEHTYCVTQ